MADFGLLGASRNSSSFVHSSSHMTFMTHQLGGGSVPFAFNYNLTGMDPWLFIFCLYKDAWLVYNSVCSSF